MKIKRNIFLKLTPIVIVAFVICGCNNTSEKQNSKNSRLEINDITWGMTVEDTLDAFNATRETASSFYENSTGAVAQIENGYEMFGEKTEQIILQFLDFKKGNGIKKLCQVDIVYPENADMKNVLNKMKEAYGDTENKITIYGMFQALSDEQLPQYDYQESDNLKLWGDSPIESIIPKENHEEYEVLWEGFQPGLNKEKWSEFSKNARLATAVYASEKNAYPSFKKNGVSFNAYNLLVLEEIKSQISKQEN